MTRYFFDIHDGGLAAWDETGIECDDHAAIEHHTRQLLNEARARRQGRGESNAAIAASVHKEGDGMVLMAVAKPGVDVDWVWSGSTD